ncbi:glycoside hydrolase family 25 protein [Streptomyces sp. NPDC054796]
MIKGVDVASYQSENYSTKGLDFVFIKITEGRSYTNPKWVAQRKTARDAGLVTGFYHFGRSGSIKGQADYFLSKINLVAGDMLVLDWEDSAVTNSEKDTWIKYVQEKAPGHKVLLYCNVNFWLNHDTTSFAGDGLWIAHYNGKPGKPGIKHPWRFHQYTSSPIDTNLGDFASRAALREWAGGTGSTTEDRRQVEEELAEG